MYGNGNPAPALAPPVPYGFPVESGERAVRCDARANLRDRRWAVPCGEMLFLPIEHQLDGRASRLRELGADHALDVGAELAAESPTHVFADHANVRLRDLEGFGEAFTRPMDRLRGHPRGELVALPLAETAMGLETHVRLHLSLIGRFDDLRGGFEARVEIAGLVGVAFLDIPALEHGRRVRPQRQRLGGDVSEHVVLHLDQPQRVTGLLFGRRGNSRDFIALIHHLATGVDHGKGRLHSRRFLRGGQIDRHDARVGMRRSKDPPVQQTRTIHVGWVLGVP